MKTLVFVGLVQARGYYTGGMSFSATARLVGRTAPTIRKRWHHYKPLEMWTTYQKVDTQG